MTKGHKNKRLKNCNISLSTSKVDNEYDLEKNFKKIKSYSRTNRNAREQLNCNITDSIESRNANSRNSNLIETPRFSSKTLPTGNHGTWESYTRLDDKITDFNYKNDQAHTDLRKELESKIKDSIKDCNESIEKRLPKQWYTWTIVGLVAIVSIWYIFSYIEVHPLPSKVEDIYQRLDIIEEDVSNLTFDRIQSSNKIKKK